MSGWYRRFTLRSVCFFYFACCLSLLGQTPSPEGTASPAAAHDANLPPTLSAAADSNVTLGIGDLIEISVFGVPDLSTKTRISGTGDVYLPLIDYVHVAGLTADEAQTLIEKRLEDGGYVRTPHVSIFVGESMSQSVTVIGEVVRPGPYAAIGNRRLFDIISAAGGLTDRAGRNVTIEHHGTPGQRVDLQLSLNLSEDIQNNVEVLPGDTIIVSRAGIIYVVGAVEHPSGFRIEDNTITVLKALALAGGGNRISSLNKASILRETPNGMQQIPVKLKKVLYAKAPDVPLVKGDVLFIPGSGAKAAAYRTADAAVALSTTLAVVGVQAF